MRGEGKGMFQAGYDCGGQAGLSPTGRLRENVENTHQNSPTQGAGKLRQCLLNENYSRGHEVPRTCRLAVAGWRESPRELQSCRGLPWNNECKTYGKSISAH